MAQDFVDVSGSDIVADTRQTLLDRDEAVRTCFSGTSFPTGGVVGQFCYRTDKEQLYQLASTGPDVWEQVARYTKGADIASATTVNLDNATGDYLHVTGTTAITGVTLAEGVSRTVVFDGALSLTYNASTLILPSKKTILTQAGDVAVFRGEGSSVTRCVQYLRANGTPIGMALSADIASAATLNLDAMTGDYGTVTGTTTVTAITLAEGQRRTVRFSGVLVLTHDTNLQLPTSANITTAVGDIATFQAEASGVKRCISYERASGLALNLTKASIDIALGLTVARVALGTSTNSGKISWGTAAPGTLDEGEIYLRHP